MDAVTQKRLSLSELNMAAGSFIIEKMPDAVCSRKNAAVLVYCRSGRRSKQAAAALAELGYTGIYEFGGIMTWPYDVVK